MRPLSSVWMKTQYYSIDSAKIAALMSSLILVRGGGDRMRWIPWAE